MTIAMKGSDKYYKARERAARGRGETDIFSCSESLSSEQNKISAPNSSLNGEKKRKEKSNQKLSLRSAPSLSRTAETLCIPFLLHTRIATMRL